MRKVGLNDETLTNFAVVCTPLNQRQKKTSAWKAIRVDITRREALHPLGYDRYSYDVDIDQGTDG